MREVQQSWGGYTRMQGRWGKGQRGRVWMSGGQDKDQGGCTRVHDQLAQGKHREAEAESLGGGDLPQQLATFPVSLPADFLRKVAGKVTGDHVTAGCCN